MSLIKNTVENSSELTVRTFTEQTKDFLESYRLCKRICDSYKEEYKAGIIPISEADDRERVYLSCMKRCDQVKEFIEALPIEPDKKKMLELHYLHGYTVERCADQLYLSRSTAFRVKKEGGGICELLLFFI